MAQLILSAASSAAASAGRAGIGAAIARTAAGVAAGFVTGQIDRLVFGPQKRKVEGPRLDALAIQASTEGAGVLRVYGRARVAGQIIWAANFKETTNETTQTAGGKGGRPAAQTSVTEYLYSLSFAVGLCEGVIDRIGRVWADGKPLDLSKLNVRIHRGAEDQAPDDLINALEEGAAPGFRGLAYVVFEDLPLRDFGNRIPQLAFEVEKRLAGEDPEALENAVTAVTMIPGTGEFVYGTTKVTREAGEGVTLAENVNNNDGAANLLASLDAAQASLPNLKAVSLIVSWFGNDLRAGACALRPGVETREKATRPYAWRAGGVDRASAHPVSQRNGAPAFGGTPADRAVREAIAAIRAAGLKVMFHPFILMDVAQGNALPRPEGGAGQPAYPWRGRISSGIADGTAAAEQDIARFFGAAGPADFAPVNGEVAYHGPPEWSFRRMILHYAHLCAVSGGVDAFLLGSELRGLTTTRGTAGGYPAVAELKRLAADVRAILGPSAKISYGADWSEYFGHQPQDGSGDIFFHLDDFWADDNIDFIGVDNYAPLADWRAGRGHADAAAGAKGPHDREYLKANIEGGEGYDWYYASPEDRDAQRRTPIADGAYGEDWIYRYKDFRGWWENAHYDRPAGVRAGAPTAWVPSSKPIVFTEIGFPAVDKGANQPNVFVDPKSSESALPHYSTGARDDLAQARALEAVHAYWRAPENNPASSVYGGPMIDTDQFYVYAWDARPYPFFPALGDLWGDAENWARGHWLNGRAGRAPLSRLVAALAGEARAAPPLRAESDGLKGVVTGYVVDRPMSPRAMIDPLADVFQFDMVEAGETLRFQMRDAPPVATLARGDLVEEKDAPFSIARAQEGDTPAAFRLGFIDEGAGFRSAVAEARDPGADQSREAGAEIAAVLTEAEAQARARAILADAHVMRETARFSLPPSALALEPGDAIVLDPGSANGEAPRLYRVTDIVDGAAREIEAVRVSPSVFEAPAGEENFRPPETTPVYGPPVWALMDLPVLREGDEAGAPAFAAYADPWPGAVALYRSTGAPGGGPSAGLVAGGLAAVPATMGRLEDALPRAAPSGRWIGATVSVRLISGSLSSRTAEEVLAGANLMAVESAAGAFEVFQFRNARLTAPGVWRLEGLLRGQAGTEGEAAAGSPAGSRVVLLNAAAASAEFSADLRGLVFDWSAGPDGELPGSENFAARSLVLNARGLMPLAPVHLRAAARTDGGFRLAWIRRARIGGDGWAGEVPLAETVERYEVRILKDGAPVRVAQTSAPAYDYVAGDVAADFGASPSTVAFEVRQWSDRVGWGLAAVFGG